MKALCVFSGGLDSMLAAALLRTQDIQVLGLFFETPFFSPEKAFQSARSIDLPLKVVNITERHLKVVKRPKHGYGGNMNPCIDCHALMFRVAAEMLENEGASFVLTGEVLGQRPMSQNKKSLNLIASESGLYGLLLRPLSAKNLPPTIPEERGWVKRDLLMDFQGRSRKPQMALARDLGISGYPSPAGGCILTEKVFSRRLKDLFSSRKNVDIGEIELLKLGRHFRIAPHAKLVVGRDRIENSAIRALCGREGMLLTTVSAPGPTALISGDLSEPLVKVAARITAAYSDARGPDKTAVRVTGKGDNRLLMVGIHDKKEYQEYMI
ncbi:MAG: tRNA 4-thiouridine(8) synthase ThiI [Deltaproteobacteria bacterium]|nr:tRNA 4-thiouridine(8) synthase ThiI [Deltaproteobacteria bacterium]